MTKPKFQATHEQRRLVEQLAACGIEQTDICALVTDRDGRAISVATLRKAFQAELTAGEIKATAKVAQNLFRIATGDGKDAVKAATIWLHTRHRHHKPKD